MHIAIIGAGMAGLTCARQLQDAGHHVTVYEAGEEVGGRMSTRQTELGGFDHGAQYFTASSDAFSTVVSSWRESGWVAPWEGRLATVDHGKVQVAGQRSAKQRMVGVPGMASLTQQLAHDIDVRTGQRVSRLEKYESQWLLRVQCESVPIDASAGPFDAVVVAMPAGEALALLQPVSRAASQLALPRMVPCWTMLLGFQDALGLGFDGAWVGNSRLGWMARDASKPLRRPGEHWVAQATPAWSEEHFDDDPERVKEKLLKAFHEATGSQIQPVYAEVHRWRFAQAVSTVPGDCLWDETARLGACGDWFAAGLDGSGRVENAYLSGHAAAVAVTGCFSNT